MDATIKDRRRLLMDASAQSDAALRYWQDKPACERMSKTWQLTRDWYMAQGVGIDYWVTDRRIRKVSMEEMRAERPLSWYDIGRAPMSSEVESKEPDAS